MVFRREAHVALAVLASALLVLAGVFASPAWATHTDEIVVDFSIEVVQGECGEEGCPRGERPVTFVPTLTVNEDESRELTADQLEAVNKILQEDADVEIAIEGQEEPIEAGETVCLEPGEYDFTAEVVNEPELAEAIEAEIGDPEFAEEDLVIEPVDDTFVVEECRDDQDGVGGGQSNVCQVVVNIVLNDVQNPDVNVNNPPEQQPDRVLNQEEATPEEPVEVSEEQVVEIAQELNVSPRIVVRCIQQNIGGDVIIGDDDNNNDDNNNDDNNNDDNNNDDNNNDDNNNDDGIDDTIIEDTTADDDLKDDVLVDTIPDKRLPDTGGVPLLGLAALGLAFVVAGALVLRGVMRRYS